MRVNDTKVFDTASSGGLMRWLLIELLRQKIVDRVITVKANDIQSDPSESLLYSFAVFETPDSILSSSKSSYYPISLDSALDFITSSDLS